MKLSEFILKYLTPSSLLITASMQKNLPSPKIKLKLNSFHKLYLLPRKK